MHEPLNQTLEAEMVRDPMKFSIPVAPFDFDSLCAERILAAVDPRLGLSR